MATSRHKPDPDPHAPLRAAKRDRWGYCGPYRLGIAVGEAGDYIPPPPHYQKHAALLYHQGLIIGAWRAGFEEGKNR